MAGVSAGWRGASRALCIGLMVLLALAPCGQAFGKGAKGSGASCDKSDDDDDHDSGGVTFVSPGTCAVVSGYVQGTGQAATVQEPRLLRGTTPSDALTVKSDLSVEGALATQFGPLKTSFELDWSYVSTTGFDQVPNLDEMNASYLGVTLGYAESLMNFWDSGDFQFSATAPDRSSYLVSYERVLTAEWSAAVAVEAGPPTTRGAETWQVPSTPPYYTARLRYEKDDWTVHLSGAVHELQTRSPPLLTGPLEWKRGWAASAGLTVPFSFVHEDDNVSLQATYAVDSSIFLGTQSDVAFLAGILPTAGPVKGWSMVGSYTHNWTDALKSELFASRLEIGVDLEHARPSVKTTRAGVNLTYEIDDHWQVGAEVDYLVARFALDSTIGLIRFNGGDLSGTTGYLWLKWQF
jgi:hypothetical protein